MGKATGFLEYERKNAAVEEPLKRIRHFNEFRTSTAVRGTAETGSALYGVRRSFLPERSHVSWHGFRLPAAQSGTGDE